MANVRSFLKKAKEIEDNRKQKQEGGRVKRASGHDDESIWLVSYADLMTLLCAFFIMMFSMSSLNAEKYERVRQEVSNHLGLQYESRGRKLEEFASQLIEDLKLKGKTLVIPEANGVTIVFESQIFFDTLSSYLLPGGRDILDEIIKRVSSHQKEVKETYKIVVEGHTDARPILSGKFPSNWELSSARASRVVRMFVNEGFDPSQLVAIGYGSTRPQVPDRTPSGNWDEEALSKNRRVVLRILAATMDTIPWESMQAAAEPAKRPTNPANAAPKPKLTAKNSVTKSKPAVANPSKSAPQLKATPTTEAKANELLQSKRTPANSAE